MAENTIQNNEIAKLRRRANRRGYILSGIAGFVLGSVVAGLSRQRGQNSREVVERGFFRWKVEQ